MTEEEAQKRIDLLWREILDNDEENLMMQYEIDELMEKFPGIG